MSIDIPPDFKEFVQDGVSSGLYQNESELITEAL